MLIDEGTFYKYEESKFANASELDNIVVTGEGLLSEHHVVIMVINLNFKKGVNGLFISEKVSRCYKPSQIDKKTAINISLHKLLWRIYE